MSGYVGKKLNSLLFCASDWRPCPCKPDLLCCFAVLLQPIVVCWREPVFKNVLINLKIFGVLSLNIGLFLQWGACNNRPYGRGSACQPTTPYSECSSSTVTGNRPACPTKMLLCILSADVPDTLWYYSYRSIGIFTRSRPTNRRREGLTDGKWNRR